jgi:hypothetical protein
MTNNGGAAKHVACKPRELKSDDDRIAKYKRTTSTFTSPLFFSPAYINFKSITKSAKMKAYWFDNEEVGAPNSLPLKKTH